MPNSISILAAYCPNANVSFSSVPWNGELILEHPGIEYTGVCLGQHNEETNFDTPKSCDKIGVRVHNLYTNTSDGTGYYWMEMDIRINATSFSFDPVYFNATFTQNVEAILGDNFTYSSDDQSFGNWRFFSLNTGPSMSDQVYTARVGYQVITPHMTDGSYSLCLMDLKCGERDEVMYRERVYKDGNTTEYDPAAHVHMYRAKVKYRCSPGSVMGNKTEVDAECVWSINAQTVKLSISAPQSTRCLHNSLYCRRIFTCLFEGKLVGGRWRRESKQPPRNVRLYALRLCPGAARQLESRRHLQQLGVQLHTHRGRDRVARPLHVRKRNERRPRLEPHQYLCVVRQGKCLDSVRSVMANLHRQ